jgi:hypothetical protein
MTAIAAVPAPGAPRVEPEAAVELVGLIQRQVDRLISEHERGANTQPNVAYQLAGALERLLEDLGRDRPFSIRRALDADAVAYVRRSVQVGRRLDMAEVFAVLNPTFGVPVDHWDGWFPRHRTVQATARRRELELSMGVRFARMLAPVEGGGVA